MADRWNVRESSLSINMTPGAERRATYTGSLTPSMTLRRSTTDRPYDLEDRIQGAGGSVLVGIDEDTPLLNANKSMVEPSTSSAASGAEKEEKVKTKKRVHFAELRSESEDGKKPPRYESLDYDICYNVPYKEKIWKYSKRTYIGMEAMRWILCGIIGILTGLVAFIIDICVKYLIKYKYELFDRLYDTMRENGDIWFGFLVLLGFNVLFAIVASILVTFEPVAGGSGIPEIKCYLNGVKIPHVARVGTLIAKAGGVLFSVAGGFFVGKEGPMIHSGAIIGAGLPQLRSMLFNFIKIPYSYFRSDRDKRDFVSSGAAAGVAAAFGAPIGGVLFSLEEGASFWNQALTWRTLFCSFCATFTLHIFLSLSEGDEFGYLRLGSPGLVNFGTFGQDENKQWTAYHLIIFMLMGAVGGLLGALFNSLNINLSKYRMKYLFKRKRIWRIPEAVLIIMVTTVCVFIAGTFLGTCYSNKHIDEREILCPELFGDVSFRNDTQDYFCPGHGIGTKSTHYNDLASLVFNSQEAAIRQLFHQNGVFSLHTLWFIFAIYFFVTCWTYGAAIPSGLFIPCIVIGATYGRFVATIFGYMYSWKPHIFGFLVNIYPGTYALIGAASFLGGVLRMTISLTVILIESTNEISYGLPIMLTLMVAKWVGDLFNEGLYDHHIELKSTPFLGWESPERMDRLIAENVMSSENLCYVYPITRVRSVENVLKGTNFSAFLVVTPVEPESVPERPTNVQSTHVPQLYGRRPYTSDDWTATEEDTDRESKGSKQQPTDGLRKDKPRETDTESEVGEVDEVDEDSARDLQLSYTIHHSSLKPKTVELRTRSPSTLREEAKEKRLSRESGRRLLMFHGIILRSQLIELLKYKVFFSEGEESVKQKKISHTELTSDYPRYPNLEKATKDLTTTERHMLMDLSLYMNPCPYTISHQAPLPQVFNLFRTMGLRHLPVMQESGIVVGIITRHDLTHENLQEKYKELEERRAEMKRSRMFSGSEKQKAATSMNINSNSVDMYTDVSDYVHFV